MDTKKIPNDELQTRLERFCAELDRSCGDWELCGICGALSMFYLTGTICDGLLLIERGGDAVLWARRSYERCIMESEFPNIRSMRSYRDVASAYPKLPDTLYLDTAFATLEWYSMLTRYMPFKSVLPADKQILKVRAVKTPYELSVMRRAGETIGRLLKDELPPLLRGGISETELASELFTLFMKNEYHALTRFSTRNSESVLGHICFAENSMYPSVFNGASGIAGIAPGAPVLGSPGTRLRDGDLVYADIGFGIEGYHADHTVIYSYKYPQSDTVNDIHRHCLEIERLAASMLKPGAKPSDIYNAALAAVRPELRDCFMGPPGRTVPFLGHSVGLYIDETPVLANGFDEPLEENMTIAIEPKIGINGVGMVGSENTYLVTAGGGVSLTGCPEDILLCS